MSADDPTTDPVGGEPAPTRHRGDRPASRAERAAQRGTRSDETNELDALDAVPGAVATATQPVAETPPDAASTTTETAGSSEPPVDVAANGTPRSGNGTPKRRPQKPASSRSGQRRNQQTNGSAAPGRAENFDPGMVVTPAAAAPDATTDPIDHSVDDSAGGGTVDAAAVSPPDAPAAPQPDAAETDRVEPAASSAPVPTDAAGERTFTGPSHTAPAPTKRAPRVRDKAARPEPVATTVTDPPADEPDANAGVLPPPTEVAVVAAPVADSAEHDTTHDVAAPGSIAPEGTAPRSRRAALTSLLQRLREPLTHLDPAVGGRAVPAADGADAAPPHEPLPSPRAVTTPPVLDPYAQPLPPSALHEVIGPVDRAPYLPAPTPGVPAPTRAVPMAPSVPAALPSQPHYVDVDDPDTETLPTAPPVRRTVRSTSAVGRRRPRVRRVTRVIRHVDPWSVFKVALGFSVVLYGVCLTAGVLLWNVAYTTGTIDNMERFFESFGWDTFEFKGGELYHNAWIAGLFAAVGLTGLIVLSVTLFNLITDLVGGVRVTVLEEEVVERDPAAKRAIRGGRRADHRSTDPYDPDAPFDDLDDRPEPVAEPIRIEATRHLRG